MRMVTSDSCNSSYKNSGSIPKETESTSSESTVSLLDRLKSPHDQNCHVNAVYSLGIMGMMTEHNW